MEKRKEQDKAKEKQQEELSKQRQIEKVTFDLRPRQIQHKLKLFWLIRIADCYLVDRLRKTVFVVALHQFSALNDGSWSV